MRTFSDPARPISEQYDASKYKDSPNANIYKCHGPISTQVLASF